jgi:hypothetical protein
VLPVALAFGTGREALRRILLRVSDLPLVDLSDNVPSCGENDDCWFNALDCSRMLASFVREVSAASVELYLLLWAANDILEEISRTAVRWCA